MSEPQSPDLHILVQRSELEPQKLKLQVWIQKSSLGPKFQEFGPVLFPASYFEEELRNSLAELDELKGTEERSKIVQRRLASIGTTLFRRLPEKLQDRIWSLQYQAKTIQILSDEPSLPWELMKLQLRGQSGWEEGPFLCEVFAVMRWLHMAREHVRIPLSKIALVVPINNDLPGTSAERSDVLSLSGPKRTVQEIEPVYLAVIKALHSGEYDAWHFSGHGSDDSTHPDCMMFHLENRPPLRADDVSARGESLKHYHPLIERL